MPTVMRRLCTCRGLLLQEILAKEPPLVNNDISLPVFFAKNSPPPHRARGTNISVKTRRKVESVRLEMKSLTISCGPWVEA